MAGNVRGKQLRDADVNLGTKGVASSVSADAAGRALFATDFFNNTTTVAAIFAAASIGLDRLEEAIIQADGGQAFTADQPLGGFQHTGVAAATAAGQYVEYAQWQASLAGLSWTEPTDAAIDGYLGNLTVAEINALTDVLGMVVVATDAGTPTSGTSDALVAGSVAEFDGTSWKQLIAGSGGFVAADTRLVVATSHTLSPGTATVLTDGVDDGKIADFDGTSLTPAFVTPTAGFAILVNGPTSVELNAAYTFNGTVPTGSWTQFNGAAVIVAGTGLSKSVNTLNVGDVNRGIQVNADDLEIDGSEMVSAAGGLEEDGTNSWQLGIKKDVTTNTAEGEAITLVAGGLSIDGDIVNIDYGQTNYTPATTGTGVDVNDLAAHLEGIDNALGAAGGTAQQEPITTEVITGTDTAITDTLDNTPASAAAFRLFLNGVLQIEGAGNDYTRSGVTVTWLASTGTAVDMDANDILTAVYES